MATLSDLAGRFAGRLVTDDTDMAPFLTDWRGQWQGRARAVVQPDRPEDVAAVVRWCANNRVPIVPQGGNTGLSGGATPDEGGQSIVLSLTRLNRIRAIDTNDNTITVDAGCILSTVQQAADDVGLTFPLSLAAQGSCTIGGNLATNAGGTAVLRYGTTRELCLGLEVVTPQGHLWNGLRSLRKDNSGYSLRDLYIGSEGTLGIITGAVMKLFPRPAGHAVAFVAVASVDAAVQLLNAARALADSALTAFELMSEGCLGLVIDAHPGSRRPFATRSAWYVLIEIADPADEVRAKATMEVLLGNALNDDTILDAVIANSLSQQRALWALRETISEAQGRIGKTIKHDVAVPIASIASFIDVAGKAVQAHWPTIRFVTFGHLGDGNLHYNFSPAEGSDQNSFLAAQTAINRTVHDIVIEHGGSISAEHGLGVLRRDEAARYKSPVERELMRVLKRALDPDGILNPGKVLP